MNVVITLGDMADKGTTMLEGTCRPVAVAGLRVARLIAEHAT